MEIVAACHAIKTGVNVASTALSLIMQLSEQVDTIMRDVADVHYTSAKQAFRAADRSPTIEGRRTEMRVGIGHCRDAYNALHAYTQSTRPFLVVFSRDLNNEERSDALRTMIELAALIAATYAHLGDWDTARSWKDAAISTFDRYLVAYDPVLREQSVIVTTSTRHSYGPVSYGGGGETTETTREFSPALYATNIANLRAERAQLSSIV